MGNQPGASVDAPGTGSGDGGPSPADEAIRIVIADDHPVVLAGLRDLLESAGGFRILATCSDGIAALAAVRAHRPSVLVLDLRMPGIDGLDVVRALQPDEARPRVVLLTAAVEGDEIDRAMALGVESVILKESALEKLVDAIRVVHQGGRPGALGLSAEERDSPGVLSGLSPRDREIALLLARGRTVAQIAREAGLAEPLVAAIVASFARQFGVADESGLRELFRIAFGVGRADRRRERIATEERRLQAEFGFTPREAAVAVLLADGMTNREISEVLGITLNTVKTHISNIHSKADVTSTRRLLVLLRRGSGARDT